MSNTAVEPPELLIAIKDSLVFTCIWMQSG